MMRRDILSRIVTARRVLRSWPAARDQMLALCTSDLVSFFIRSRKGSSSDDDSTSLFLNCFPKSRSERIMPLCLKYVHATGFSASSLENLMAG